MRQKVLVVLVLLLAAGSLYGGWHWYRTYYQVPGLPTTVQEAVKVLGSPAFKRLPESRRAEYVDTSRKLFEKMPIEERRAFMRSMRDDPNAKEAGREAMAEMMMGQAKAFAKLPEPAQNLILDRIIEQQEKMVERMKNAKPSSPEEKAKREERMKNAMREMRAYIQRQIESGNPQRQALVGEGMKALRDRRVQKGLPPDPPAIPPH